MSRLPLVAVIVGATPLAHFTAAGHVIDAQRAVGDEDHRDAERAARRGRIRDHDRVMFAFSATVKYVPSAQSSASAPAAIAGAVRVSV